MTHTHAYLNDLQGYTPRRLAVSLSLTAVFVLVEVAAGLYANSLALPTGASTASNHRH